MESNKTLWQNYIDKISNCELNDKNNKYWSKFIIEIYPKMVDEIQKKITEYNENDFEEDLADIDISKTKDAIMLYEVVNIANAHMNISFVATPE